MIKRRTIKSTSFLQTPLKGAPKKKKKKYSHDGVTTNSFGYGFICFELGFIGFRGKPDRVCLVQLQFSFKFFVWNVW